MYTARLPRSRARFAPLMLLALLACSDEDEPSDRQIDAATPLDAAMADGGTSDGTVPPAAADPLYIVHSAVQNPDGARTNYFTLTKSLTAPETLNYANAIAQPGRSRLYAQQDLGFFAIGAGETLAITRYTVGPNDTIVPGASLSLRPQGVTSLGAQAVYFVSETKAYYKDAANAQVIVWNPKEMKFERKIELPAELIRQGYSISVSQWGQAEGQVYFALGWTTTTFDKVLPDTKLVRIDTATDALTVTDDNRCRGLNQTANFNGALYFFSDVINAFGHAVYPNEGGQPACAVRINAGQTTFDPTYVGNVAGAFRADQAATVVDVTSDGIAWVQVADLKVAPTAPGTTYNQWYDKGWNWYQVPLATLQNPTAVATPSGAYSGITATVDAEFLITQAAADYSTSTLNALSSGTPKPGVTFGGFALDVARLR
jgi:hypothetical protein